MHPRPFTAHDTARLRYASFVVLPARLVYVETPKAACTSLKHTVAALGRAHPMQRLQQTAMAAKTLAQAIHDRALVALPSLIDLTPSEQERILTAEDGIRFCVVRNPYDRLASAWADRLLMHSLSPLATIVSQLGLPRYLPDWGYLRACFGEFVMHLWRNEFPHFSNHHWWTMTQLLMPERLNYNLVIRIEDFRTGLRQLIAHVESQGIVWPGLPRFNETPLPGARHLYTPAAARKVREMYAEDFETFGYDPEFSPPREPPPPLPDAACVHALQARNRRIFELSLRLRGLL